MKKNKIMFIIMLIICIFSIDIIINNSYAMSGGESHNLRDVVNDISGEYYKSTNILDIDADDVKYLNDVDFSKFEILEFIFIKNADLKEINSIKIGKKMKQLSISNTVFDYRIFDEDEYNYISSSHNYNIGDIYEGSKFDFINSENNINNEYDKKIDEIAKEIYLKSDKTTEGIIKDVTLYVIDNIEYDYNGQYTHLSTAESVVDKKMGVCSHYAWFEGQLLNKLGIFTISVAGYNKDPNIDAHAWNIVYVNNEWYSIDATWHDNEISRNNIMQNNSAIYYMRPITDSVFNSSHTLLFNVYDHIPVEKRKNNMSIIEKYNLDKKDESESKEDETEKEESENKKGEVEIEKEDSEEEKENVDDKKDETEVEEKDPDNIKEDIEDNKEEPEDNYDEQTSVDIENPEPSVELFNWNTICLISIVGIIGASIYAIIKYKRKF